MKAFLSYSHQDFEASRGILQALREAAQLVDNPVESVWVDKSIQTGERFREGIQHAIQTSDIALLLVSDDFFKSEFIRDVELPAIKARLAQNRMAVLPVKIGHFLASDYEAQLRDLQAWPMLKGKLASVADLPDAGKEHAFADLHRCAVAAGKLLQRKIELKPPERLTEAVLQEIAKKLAGYYRQIPEQVIYGLAFIFWMLWEFKRDHAAALQLAGLFYDDLNNRKMKLDKGHHPTVELLKAGFPRTPTHLQILEISNVSQLLEPNFAKLLHGMRLSEGDYQQAESFFQKLGEAHSPFENCALVEYAWGQCARKHQHLDDAVARYLLALGHCSAWSQETCECPGKCPKGMLMVEIRRGLGAAYRRLGKRDLALQHFEAGNQLLNRTDVPTRIKADFLYSFGYFLFEDAVNESLTLKSLQLTGDQTRRLRTAEQVFRNCISFQPEHPAAHARLEIVKRVLGNFDLSGWIHSRTLCLKYHHGEPVLTAFLSGFALCLYSLVIDSTRMVGVNSRELYQELAEVFERWPNGVPLGPINCHIFDTTVVLWNANIQGDDWLRHAFDLLSTSRQWTETERGNLKEKQLEGLREFELRRGIKRRPRPN
jgi:tetratricopeptide (TPR) repeat protein